MLGLKVFLTGLILVVISVPFIRGKAPSMWIALPLLIAFTGGAVAMIFGLLIAIWI